MEVYVLDKCGTPLMPTERCGWVAYALKHGEAKVVRCEPFTIRLLRDSTRYLQAVTLGVDTGSRHIGLSATTEKKELYSAQVELRTDVSELLTARREFRRGRRGRKHNWYRPARWQNRHGIEKSHASDAYCIAGNFAAERNGCNRYLHKFVRRHNRCLHKSTILKGGYRKANQAPKYVFGFRLFDMVSYKGIPCFVFGRRSSGSFDIRTLEGKKISAGVSYKRLKPLTKSTTMLTERSMRDSSQP